MVVTGDSEKGTRFCLDTVKSPTMEPRATSSASRLEQLLTAGRKVKETYENATTEGKSTPEIAPGLSYKGDETPVVSQDASGDNEKYHRNPRKRLLNNTNPTDSEQRERDQSGKAKKMPKTGHPKAQVSDESNCNNEADNSPVGNDKNSHETNDTASVTPSTKAVKPKDDYEYMGAQIDKLLKMPSPPGIRWKDNDRKFKCKLCPKSFLNNDDLKSHALEHSDDKSRPKERKVRERKSSKGSQPEVDSKKSSKSQESPARSWDCSCGETFTTKAALMRHKRNDHPKSNANSLENLPKVDLGATLIDVNRVNDLKNDESIEYSDPPQLSIEVSSSSPVAVQTAFSIISTGILGKNKTDGNEDSRRPRGNGLQSAQNASPVMPSPSSTRSSRSGKTKANSPKTKATSDSKSSGKKKSNSQVSKSASSEDEHEEQGQVEAEATKAPTTPSVSGGRTSSRRNIQKPKWLTDSDLVLDYELPGTNAMRSSVAASSNTPSNLTNGNKSTVSSSPELKKVSSPAAAINKSDKNKRRASSSRDMDQEQKQARLVEVEEGKKIPETLVVIAVKSKPKIPESEAVLVKSKPKKPKKLKKEKSKEKEPGKKVRKPRAFTGTPSKKSPTKRKSSSNSLEGSKGTDAAEIAIPSEPSIQAANVSVETDAKKLLEILEDREPETQTVNSPSEPVAKEPARAQLASEETVVFPEAASNPASTTESEPIGGCQSSLSGQGSSSRMSFGSNSAVSSGLFSNVESPSFADISSGKYKIQSPATVLLPRSSLDSNNSSSFSAGPFSVVESVSFADISAGKVSVSEVKRPRTASIASEEGRKDMEIVQPQSPVTATQRRPSVEQPQPPPQTQANEEVKEMPVLKPEGTSKDTGASAEVSEPIRDATNANANSIDENHSIDPSTTTTSLTVPVSEKAPLLCQEVNTTITSSNAAFDVVETDNSPNIVSEKVAGSNRDADPKNTGSCVSHDPDFETVDGSVFRDDVSMSENVQNQVTDENSYPMDLEELEDSDDEEDDVEEVIVRGRRNRSDSLSMRSCGSGSQSEKIKALEDAAVVKKKDKRTSSFVKMTSDECYIDSDSDSNDSLMSEFSELAAQVSENTDGVMLKEECMRFLVSRISSKNMWSIRKELKRLKKNKNYFKFGKLAPLAGGLMHDIFCQSVLEED